MLGQTPGLRKLTTILHALQGRRLMKLPNSREKLCGQFSGGGSNTADAGRAVGHRLVCDGLVKKEDGMDRREAPRHGDFDRQCGIGWITCPRSLFSLFSHFNSVRLAPCFGWIRLTPLSDTLRTEKLGAIETKAAEPLSSG